MNKNSAIDYLSCILFRVLAFFVKCVPVTFSLFLGGRLGDLLYYFSCRHKSIAYSNIKTAFGKRFSPRELNRLTHEFYRSFGQNLMEIFFIPFFDKKYFDRYVSFQGREFISEAFKNGKGVILLGVHAGSWELSNVICANLGFAFNLFVRDQRYPRLNKLLNHYRSQKGCKIIERQNQTRALIEALKNNEAVGLTADQGGRQGLRVKFFGKSASMPTGAVRLALKYDSVILPAFYTRIKGAYIRTIIEPPFKVKKTGDPQKDIWDNLQEIIHIFERNIERHIKDYLWSYKIWKYADENNILILSDGKAGHLRQAQAVAKIAKHCLEARQMRANIETVEIKFRNSFSKSAFLFGSCLAGKYRCQGCLWCLRAFLEKDNYEFLIHKKFDIIISCGFSLAPVNYVLARENLAKSIAVMRPSLLSTKRFDLVIMPKHDAPQKRKNVIVTEGALNLIDDEYLKEQTKMLLEAQGSRLKATGFYIGLLIGGDSKDFHLKSDQVLEVIRQAKSVAEKLDANILLTTSRRTSAKIEGLVKGEFKDCPRCKLLVIANENNIPMAVGGILGLSEFIIVSAESISMISEAINSKKYVLVFESGGLRKKHRAFIENCRKNKYIYLTQSHDLSKKIEDLWFNKPEVSTPADNLMIEAAIKKIL
jgi:lauroyl/myristoyl acyltransferase/mitochondrial fission protein ELM1